MHRRLTILLAVLLALPAHAGDVNTWNKLRYNGGTVQAKVNPFDWNTAIAISADAIDLRIGRQSVQLKPAQITSLSYGQLAYRRVADMVALSVIATPLALFGILHRSKTHLIGIEFNTADGKPGAILLEADKNAYRAILQRLSAVTGKEVKDAP
jgi:hypothetical protein